MLKLVLSMSLEKELHCKMQMKFKLSQAHLFQIMFLSQS